MLFAFAIFVLIVGIPAFLAGAVAMYLFLRSRGLLKP
jgi:hypothetical protein